MRKKLLCAVLLLIAIASKINAQTTKIETSKPTIVIVHGTWGGGWAFKKVEALLRQKGFDSKVRNLQGKATACTSPGRTSV